MGIVFRIHSSLSTSQYRDVDHDGRWKTNLKGDFKMWFRCSSSWSLAGHLQPWHTRVCRSPHVPTKKTTVVSSPGFGSRGCVLLTQWKRSEGECVRDMMSHLGQGQPQSPLCADWSHYYYWKLFCQEEKLRPGEGGPRGETGIQWQEVGLGGHLRWLDVKGLSCPVQFFVLRKSCLLPTKLEACSCTGHLIRRFVSEQSNGDLVGPYV